MTRTGIVLTAAAAVAMTACSGEKRSAETPGARQSPAKVTMFYAAPNVARRGDAVKLCYGVEDAKAVRLEPQVEEVKPALSRCVEITASKTTEYKLTATGADGQEVTRTATVEVSGMKPPEAEPQQAKAGGLIRTFAATATQVRKGQPVTICYEVAEGATVQFNPPFVGAGGTKSCIGAQPGLSTTYTLIAKKGAAVEKQSITIRVE